MSYFLLSLEPFSFLPCQVEVLIMEKNESALGRQSAPTRAPGSLMFEKHSSSAALASKLNNESSQQCLIESAARQNLASAIEHGSGRKSLSQSLLVDANSLPSDLSLRKQFDNNEEYNADVKVDKNSEDDNSFFKVKNRSF